MKILIFDPRWIEPAEVLKMRTGIEIEKGDWKPEKKKAYIIFGGEHVINILKHAAAEFELYYIFMKPENIKDLELLRLGISLTHDMEKLEYYRKNEIEADYGVMEYLYQGESHDDDRPNKFLREAEVRDVVHIGDKTKLFMEAEYYVADANDWDNIHKALACACRVISPPVNDTLTKMYEPFVLFTADPENNSSAAPEPDYKKFLETVITYSLNISLNIIKNVYIQTEGVHKERVVNVSPGTSEDGRTFFDVSPKEEANISGGHVW